MGLFPKKVFCSLSKAMGSFPSKDGSIDIILDKTRKFAKKIQKITISKESV